MPLDATLLECGPANVYFDGVLLGYMGEALQVSIGTEATPLTGAQTGNVAHNKVVSGGHFRVTVPFKEVSAKNISLGVANSVFVSSGSLIFKVRAGRPMRQDAKVMTIVKLVGGDEGFGESTLPEDTLTIPECSPVDSEVVIPFHPTEQRVIAATFEAWPDENGVWAYFGAAPV